MKKCASRFECPSSWLALNALLRGAKKALCLAAFAALALHISLTRIVVLKAEKKAVRPLTTYFVKRQPRLTKPLELKKRAQPRRRQLRRDLVSIKARASKREMAAGILRAQALGALARPRVDASRLVRLSKAIPEPRAMAQVVEGTMESQHTLNTSLEMLDIDALDTGHYQAMVIQDPNDKRNVKGYLHLAIAYPFCVRNWRSYDNVGRLTNAVSRLVGKLNEWTQINASIARRVPFDSPELFQTPWVYLSIAQSLEPTPAEIESLGGYLLSGGFFFFQGNRWRQYQGERYIMLFVESALQSQGFRHGPDWEYQRLPNSHPVFHCYYDFPDGPPTAYMRQMLPREDGLVPYSQGIEINGHLSVFTTNAEYGLAWADWGHSATPTPLPQYDPTIQFQFGINTIIFALTQEGSITHRVMDSVQ